MTRDHTECPPRNLTFGKCGAFAALAAILLTCAGWCVIDELQWHLYQQAHHCTLLPFQAPEMSRDVRYEDARWLCDGREIRYR